jgi:two-component system alkaline phosphatase synthesis response regulator PhoP
VSESETKRDPLVVVVEDDAAIAEGQALNMNLQGFRSAVVGDGEAAYPQIKETQPDLVLLDITLPKRSGIWVLERLREDGNQVPVIVLSARQNEFDKVAALQLGADDYVTKPFALAELLARVAAVLRRTQLSSSSPEARPPAAKGHLESGFKFGDVVVDLQTRTVTRANQDVRLTHLEFELLSFFCHHSQRVYSREELLHEVWGVRHAGQARTVDNFMAQLRAKLEVDPDRPKHLLTVRGSGYRFLPE